MKKRVFRKKVVNENSRITNDTLSEHRREAIEKGKQFKYPLQYEKHKVVINTILIGVTVLFLLGGGLWWSLYKAQLDSKLLFKITRFIPLSVGKIDQSPILYSDYLAQYRVSLHYYQTKEVTVDNRQAIPDDVKQRFRRQAMENATLIALARKIANEKQITVTSQEMEADLDQKRTINNEQIAMTEFNRIVEDYYGLSASEYQTTFIENPLLIKKVAIAIDKPAEQLAKKIKQDLQSGQSMPALASKHQSKVDFFDSGLVKVNNSDGGRSALANTLEPGQVSEPFVLADATGYCFVQLVSRDKKDNINYLSLTIRLEELNNQLKALQEQGRIHHRIQLEGV